MGEKWDQRRNQKVSGNKWKLTHNNTKSMGHSECSLDREFRVTQASLKRKETFQKKQPNPTPTRTWGTTKNPEQVQGWK